jgi:hypothetical protein
MDALRKLAKEREALELECDLLANAEEQLHSAPEYSFWLIRKGAKDLARQDVQRAYAEVCAVALVEYESSKNPKPAVGVQIEEFNKVVYESGNAWDWCAEHALKYLVLDVKAFEKAASVLRDLGAPVELSMEARVQNATNLDVWLPDALLASEEINLLREEQDLAEKQS